MVKYFKKMNSHLFAVLEELDELKTCNVSARDASRWLHRMLQQDSCLSLQGADKIRPSGVQVGWVFFFLSVFCLSLQG